MDKCAKFNKTNMPEINQYFYHPDHLGSSSFITDVNGEADQHIQYLPFGELFVSQRNGSFDSRYKFTAKELDNETNYTYFGARYYDSGLSVWLSVDPMADQRSWVSPYSYCQNSPIGRVDPSGMLDWYPEITEANKINYIAEKGDNALTLSKQYGISQSSAELITGSKGSMEIKEGTKISGEKVKKITGNKILKLDLNNSTSQQRIDQISLALNYNREEPDGFYIKDYFKNYKLGSFGVAKQEKGFIRTPSGKIPISFMITYNGSNNSISTDGRTIYNASNDQFNAEFMYNPKRTLPAINMRFFGKNNLQKISNTIEINWDGATKEEKTPNPFKK